MRFFLFILVIATLSYSVFNVTKSLLMGFVSVVLFLLLWLFLANARSIYRGKHFNSLFKKYALEEKFPDKGEFAEGYMYFDGQINSAGVLANDNGIYIYSMGICECKIQWESVFDLSLEERNKNTVAKISLTNGFEREKELYIPWKNEFNAVFLNSREKAKGHPQT